MLHTLAERERLIGLVHLTGWIALAAAVAASVWFAARIIWLWFPAESPATATAPVEPGTATRATDPGGVDLAALHLFGQSALALPLAATANAPDTSLDLRLLGTLVSGDDGAGMAIIADAGREALYAVGDEIPGEARLYEVHPDRVTLIHLGRYETLRLREEEPRSASARRAATRPRPATRAPGEEAIDWQAAQRSARLDPARLAQQVRALPVVEDGQPIGFRLQAGRDAALIGKLGLRPTDVITAVNGIPLNDPARAFELINQLNSETRFSVDLKRDGREMTLTVDANLLTE